VTGDESELQFQEAHRVGDIKQGAYRATFKARIFRNGSVACGQYAALEA
jgi:hypothetical protein